MPKSNRARSLPAKPVPEPTRNYRRTDAGCDVRVTIAWDVVAVQVTPEMVEKRSTAELIVHPSSLPKPESA